MSHSKIAIVTGAGTGVGKAAALALLADGWRVALIGRRLQPLEDVTAASHSPSSCLPLSVDVAETWWTSISMACFIACSKHLLR